MLSSLAVQSAQSDRLVVTAEAIQVRLLVRAVLSYILSSIEE